MGPSFTVEPPKLTPHGAETSHPAEPRLNARPTESGAIQLLSLNFGVMQPQWNCGTGSGTGMHAFTGKMEIASIRQHARALPGLLACASWKGRAGSQSRATQILPPGWPWHPEVTKIKE